MTVYPEGFGCWSMFAPCCVDHYCTPSIMDHRCACKMRVVRLVKSICTKQLTSGNIVMGSLFSEVYSLSQV